MVKIIIENLAQKELVVSETNQPALKVFQSHGMDWMHECGGKGRCTTCKVIVTAGMGGLPPLTPAEKNYRGQGLLADNERLSCQVRVTGSIRIRVPDESKLPHVKYSF